MSDSEASVSTSTEPESPPAPALAKDAPVRQHHCQSAPTSPRVEKELPFSASPLPTRRATLGAAGLRRSSDPSRMAGCVVQAVGIGQAVSSASLKGQPSSSKQAAVDRAISVCLARQGREDAMHMNVTLSMFMGQVTVFTESGTLMNFHCRTVAFCGTGLTDGHCFALAREGPDQRMICDVFKSESVSSAKACVEALARAFGAQLVGGKPQSKQVLSIKREEGNMGRRAISAESLHTLVDQAPPESRPASAGVMGTRNSPIIHPSNEKREPDSPPKLFRTHSITVTESTPPASPRLGRKFSSNGSTTSSTLDGSFEGENSAVAHYLGHAEVVSEMEDWQAVITSAVRCLRSHGRRGEAQVQVCWQDSDCVSFSSTKTGRQMKKYSLCTVESICLGSGDAKQVFGILRRAPTTSRLFVHVFDTQSVTKALTVVETLDELRQAAKLKTVTPTIEPEVMTSKFTRRRSRSFHCPEETPEVVALKAKIQGVSAAKVTQIVREELSLLNETDQQALSHSISSLADHQSEDERAETSVQLLCDYYNLQANKERIEDLRQNKEAPLVKSPTRASLGSTLRRTLTSSFENLLKRKPVAEPTHSMSPLSNKGSSSSVISQRGSVQEQLFDSVTSRKPRDATPKRRSVRSRLSDRSEAIRARWRRIGEKQMLLLRNEKHERLQQQRAAMRRHVERDLEELWKPVLEATPPSREDFFREVCKAVPCSLRGKIWKAIAELEPFDAKFSYVDMLVEPCIYLHAIMIDIDRTFPDHEMFLEHHGSGQMSLFNAMKAYSILDAEVGYCQGLSFVGGLLLMHLDEQDAFTVLRHFMYNKGMRHQYKPDMEALQMQLYQFTRLIHDQLPSVFEHFQKHEIEPFLYATPWFLSLFSSQFSVDFSLRVLDFVLLEGIMFVFKVGIALLQLKQADLIACDHFESTLVFIQKTIPAGANIAIETVLKMAVELPVTVDQLSTYAREFSDMQESKSIASQRSSVPAEVLQLTDDLSESQATCTRLKSELNVAVQQVNHAKSALRALREEKEEVERRYRLLEEENRLMRQVLAQANIELDLPSSSSDTSTVQDS